MKKVNKNKKKLKLGGLQQYQQPQQQSIMDSQSEQQSNALVNGVGAVNPIVGAFMKVGQGVGKQTMDQNGIYKGDGIGKRANSFIDNSINPTTGIQNFKDLPKNLNASTIANQLTGGIFGKSATQVRREKELKYKNNLEAADTNLNLISNSGFAKGGKMPSKLKVLSGGSLNPVSKDAVEVNASNPSQTDSVELTNAFVDNNEIIDRKNRVFSDEIIGPSGKSIAKEAKKLEKMKSTSSRFKDSNDRLDGQLDKLFKYQEDSKKVAQDNTKLDVSLAATKASSTKHKNNRIFDNDPFVDLVQRSYASEDMGKLFSKKKGLDTGGTIDPKKQFSHYLDQPELEDGFADATVPTTNSMDWSKVFNRNNTNTAATFAPNVANIFLQKKLKGPRSPMLETDLRLDRVDPSAQLAENARQSNLVNNIITRNTAQGANLSSSLGSVLAKRLASNNAIYGQTQNINAGIQGQEASLNQGIRARNTERVNDYRTNQVDFTNKKLAMTSDNIANASNKLQGINREKNLMALDKDKFAIIQARFEDLPEEMKAKYPSVFDYYNQLTKEGKSKGGKLNRMRGGKLYC